jgi:hypothetical protein
LFNSSEEELLLLLLLLLLPSDMEVPQQTTRT